MRILITSGSGTVGQATVGPLLEAGVTVRVVSRHPEVVAAAHPRVEQAVGDLGDPAGLAAALDDVDRVFLITPLHPEEARLGKNVIDAARAANVERIVMLGVHRAEQTPQIPHFGSKVELEASLRASDIAWTVLAPNNFFQNDFWFRDAMLQAGVYPQPFGDAGMSRVDVRDIAAAAVVTLTTDGHEGRRYPLVGPDVLTATGTAELWAKQLDRPVAYAGNDLDAWAVQAGAAMPEWMVDDLRMMYAHFQERGLAATDEEVATCARLLGAEPRRFEAFVEETARGWRDG